jgi:hypothetical protein
MIMEKKIEVAIELLKEGKSFFIDNIRLSINELNNIQVAGWSNVTIFKNLSKKESLKELVEVKNLFSQMCESSIELKNFIKGKDIEYELYFDDYGKTSIKICSEKNNEVIWFLKL